MGLRREPSTTCLPLSTTCCKARDSSPLSSRSSQPASTQTSAFSPLAGPGLPGSVVITCGHEEDAGTQDDVVSSLVELAGCDAESTHEKQDHTQDRENARGSHGPCGTWRARERKSVAVRLRHAGEEPGSTQEWGFMDTAPQWRLLSNPREEGEGVSYCPAHGPAEAQPGPQAQLQCLLRPTGPCVTWSLPGSSLMPTFPLVQPQQLPISCHCMLLTLTH